MGGESSLEDGRAVAVELGGGVAVVTLNRPDAINALNDPLRVGLTRAFRDAEADPDVKVVVLRAAGERGFCVGADIKEFRPPVSLAASRRWSPDKAYIAAIGAVTKPTIAAIHGFCLGGGFEIAMACDLRVAAPDAVFGLPEVNLGLMPGSGGTQRLPRLIGPAMALDLMLTGRRFSAEEALSMGVVSRVVASRDVLFSEAKALAEEIAAKSPLATAFIKEAVHSGVDMSLNEGIRLERDLFTLLGSTEDKQEAAAAFREKRRPVFKGR